MVASVFLLLWASATQLQDHGKKGTKRKAEAVPEPEQVTPKGLVVVGKNDQAKPNPGLYMSIQPLLHC